MNKLLLVLLSCSMLLSSCAQMSHQDVGTLGGGVVGGFAFCEELQGSAELCRAADFCDHFAGDDRNAAGS